MLVDLHVHTTASDGLDNPRDVVCKAKKLNLKAIAITDHDTFGGLQEALQATETVNMEVVTGIELSAEYKGKEVHILGYLMDIMDKDLAYHLSFFKKSRVERVHKIVQKLQQLNLPICKDEVLSQAEYGIIGRPHIARVLINKGVVGSVGEAFDKYIGQDGMAFVPRVKYTPAKAIRLIRNAGGVAVIAHPGLAKLDNYIPRLVEEGLQGIEVYHPQHSQVDIDHYLYMARQYELLVTGGSDYHGPDARGHETLGTATVSYHVVKEIYNLAGS
ncbi:MAG: PHP domain-containing protein [Firmicutes bacterium]|nr:PHP domain-containing protein [Bacillota bacterium]